jgi:hypothetical protein
MMSLPSLEEIESYFVGSWHMMTGRRDGIDRLDISVDGFWRSFHAITVALPPLLVNWVAYSLDLPEGPDEQGFRLNAVIVAGLGDILAWIVPILVLAIAARRLGLARRFSVYVIASNWGGALLSWIALPPTLARFLWPEARDVALLLSVVVFGAELVLSYRLAQVAWQRPHGFALPLFIALTAASLAVTFLFQNLVGIGPGL